MISGDLEAIIKLSTYVHMYLYWSPESSRLIQTFLSNLVGANPMDSKVVEKCRHQSAPLADNQYKARLIKIIFPD